MKLWLVVATSFCLWITVFGSARVGPSTPNNELKIVYPAASLATDTTDEDVYSNFINNLRKQLDSGNQSYKIPLLRANVPVTSNNRFILVNLSNPEQSTTLAIDVTNAYVVGFRVGIYSYYFSDTKDDVYKTHPLQTKNQTTVPFGGGYPAMENFGAFREQTILGITQLNAAVFTFNKWPTKKASTTQVASAFLVAIQMISEAVRFKYIQNEVVKGFFTFNPKRGDFISHENNWDPLSKAIQNSKDGTFSPIQFKDIDYNVYYVSTVSDIQADIGILLNVAAKSSKPTMFWLNGANLFKKLLTRL